MLNRIMIVPLLILPCGCGPTLDGQAIAQRQFQESLGQSEKIALRVEGGVVDVAGEDPETLTLPVAARRALQSDSRIQIALARVNSTQAEARQARLLPNPIVSVSFRFPEGGGSAIIDAGLTAEVIALLQRPRRISAADYRLRAAVTEALTAALDVLSDVQDHYVAVQALDVQITIAVERRKLLGRLLDMARARVRAGEATALEVTTLDAERIALEVEVSQQQAERADERLILSRLIGNPSGPANWRVTEWEAPAKPSAGEAEWLAVALERRPEVQARRWELAALGDEAALAAFAPFQATEASVESERDQTWSVGPGLATPLPLFDWGQAERAKARAAKIEARHKLTQARREVVEDVRRAYAAFLNAQATVEKARTELVPVQQRRREQAEAAYRIGETDVTTVLLAEQDFQEARSKLVELQQKTSTALFRLQRAVGGPAATAGLQPRSAATQAAPPGLSTAGIAATGPN